MVCSTTAGSIYVMMQMVTDLVGQGFFDAMLELYGSLR